VKRYISAIAFLVWFLTIFSFALPVMAGEMVVSWQPPVLNCDGSQLTNLAGYDVRWGTKVQNLPDPAATGFTTPKGLTPGEWWVSVSAYNTTGEWSQFVTATKTVAPEEFVTTGTVVYTFVKRENGIITLPVGTVALGVVCDAAQSVNGKYVVPRGEVTWSGLTRPTVVVADCG
jgi:hypothetical protein